ncbi:hypothetical protein L249_0060 [Ophiocordyceps polyrhachis-furcata BCC 54312]|uniref:Uncharacterized protein n=1 Tax=Ophiocordyceps polyrhachis-furcata BCC 54312 TaxID=1330021 RepID=A0A367LDK9_9HYPO|nr:hypothetical protein L249_0060 [Ophiocordyceps polyrhachis-furcata BCC 54312]
MPVPPLSLSLSPSLSLSLTLSLSALLDAWAESKWYGPTQRPPEAVLTLQGIWMGQDLPWIAAGPAGREIFRRSRTREEEERKKKKKFESWMLFKMIHFFSPDLIVIKRLTPLLSPPSSVYIYIYTYPFSSLLHLFWQFHTPSPVFLILLLYVKL